MKKVKLLIAACLAGLFLGCNDSGGLIPIKNENPKISDEKFNQIVKHLNDEFGKDYDFYHIESVYNLNYKDEDKEIIRKDQKANAENSQSWNFIQFLLVDKKTGEKEFVGITCYDEANSCNSKEVYGWIKEK